MMQHNALHRYVLCTSHLDKICFLLFYVKLKKLLYDSIRLMHDSEKAVITDDAEKSSFAVLHFLDDW